MPIDRTNQNEPQNQPQRDESQDEVPPFSRPRRRRPTSR